MLAAFSAKQANAYAIFMYLNTCYTPTQPF